MTPVFSACERESDRLVALARELVASESPSDDAPALEACAALLAERLTEAGARVTRPAGPAGVPHVEASWSGDRPPVLILGHFDTVWPVGQLGRQPLIEREGKLFGPGVFDMKAGLAIAVTAIRVVQALVPAPKRPALTLLATSDEEVGSANSRALIESRATRSQAVLVLEPSLPGGAVKTSRKGVAEFEIQATGVAAHAGVDPAKGASAVHEIARQVIAAQALADPSRGLTVNVGLIEGGTRPNVIAAQARALVDVRISRLEDGPRIERAFRGLRATDSRVTLIVAGGVNRPPMERGSGVAALYAVARDVAGRDGWLLEEGGTGGGSDGNFCAALGVPTLDGLGPTGDGAHALHEHVIIKDLASRAALVAGLIARLGDNGS